MTVSTPTDRRLHEIHEHRALFTALGIAMIVLGACAFIATFLFTMATMLALGIILIIAGVAQIVQAARHRGRRTAGWTIAAGILYVIAGALLIYNPLAAALSLTLILAAFLIVSGIIRVVHASEMRTNRNWGWLAVGGVLDVILGALIAAQWPVSGLWVIGLFLGIDLIFHGGTWIALANAPERPLLPQT